MGNRILLIVGIALVLLIALLLLAVRSATRVGEQLLEESPSPTATPVETLLPIPSPTPVVLTPDQEQLTDLETEGEATLTFDETLTTDSQQLNQEAPAN